MNPFECCHGCGDRKVGCHGDCEKYQSAAAEHRQQRAEACERAKEGFEHPRTAGLVRKRREAVIAAKKHRRHHR